MTIKKKNFTLRVSFAQFTVKWWRQNRLRYVLWDTAIVTSDVEGDFIHREWSSKNTAFNTSYKRKRTVKGSSNAKDDETGVGASVVRSMPLSGVPFTQMV